MDRHPFLVSSCGLALLVLAIGGIIYGSLAAIAQYKYHDARYGAGRDDPERMLRSAETAHRLYPWNYFLCLYVMQDMLHRSYAAEDAGTRQRLERASERWCRTGLRINPYHPSLRLRWADILADRDMRAGIRYMEDIVEWLYWSPHHHAQLAEFYARAGEFAKADQQLYVIKERKNYADAAAAVQTAKDAFLERLTLGLE